MWRMLAAWRRNGVGGALHVAVSRIRDRIAERRMGLITGGLIPIESLVDDWHGCHDYFPTAFDELRTVLASLQPGPRDVFVDIGAGKGRALLVAAAFPFRSVIGVEVARTLCADARANVARCADGLACRDVRVVEADGARWPIPEETTFVYLYNPFHGERLIRLFANIAASLAAAPRELMIVYNNPSHFEPLERDYPWLRRHAVYAMEYRWIVYRAAPIGGSPGIAEESAV